MKLIFQEKGILGLYKGWGATMCGIAPYAGIKLSSYQTLRNIIFGHDAKIGNVTNLVLGAIAGCVAVTITYPTDLMRRKMQVMVLTD
jgi:solute carrier family 25 phosphate transporter 23/24/25/41